MGTRLRATWEGTNNLLVRVFAVSIKGDGKQRVHWKSLGSLRGLLKKPRLETALVEATA